MADAKGTTATPQGKQQSFTPLPSGKRQYLLLYNLVSFMLWTLLLVRVILVCSFSGGTHGYTLFGNMAKHTTAASQAAEAARYSTSRAAANTYASSHTWVMAIQSVALLEVVHSLVGLVRAPVMTTAMQVASRLLLVWGVVFLFGEDLLIASPTARISGFVKRTVGLAAGKGEEERVWNNQQAYLGMLIAWSVTECIRYIYFVFFLGPGQERKADSKAMMMGMGVAGVPNWLTWLRYNAFFVLYPLGISCEVYLVYAALPFAKQWDVRYNFFLIAVLAIYVPGSYILYTHMMKQRRRQARSSSSTPADAKKTR